ncbi:MAG: MmgE/PrpD family protein, partial [Chloroflexota bacterium]
MNETRKLVEFIVGVNYESLPASVVEMAKLCILDTVGVGLFGSQTKWANVVAGLATRARCQGDSALWGHDMRTAPEYAALVNGTGAHGIEMDDRKPPYDAHTGAIVIPTALAAAESGGIDGKKFITSVVVGYESAYRVGKAVPKQLERGIHAPAHKGIWGATAAASKALGLDVERSLNAFGIAGYMASGLWEFSQDPQRATVKRLHGGWPAHSGVMAALLARDGLTGPATVLEGKYGYCRVYAGEEPPR